MNILVIGSGGREHAIATAYAKSKRVKNVYVVPGNDYMIETSNKIHVFPHIDLLAFEKILTLAKKHSVDLVDVAQDTVLANGYVDSFLSQGFPAFGPTKSASEIEWSKEWSRTFMKKYKLPIPHYEVFSSKQKAIEYITKKPEKLRFIKASGLALGKGVIKAETKKEAIDAISSMTDFGDAGKTFLIEDGMIGEEFSLFAICDGKRYVLTGSAQDHKTVFTGDFGPNTGGMGCNSPVSFLTKKVISEIRKTIINPFIHGMELEGRPYTGVIYLGGMMTKDGPKVVEFNARWGDPEATVILPGLQSDYVDLIEATVMQSLITTPVSFDNKVRISIAACAKGYPQNYKDVLGKTIHGLTKAKEIPGISIFGAGMKRKGKKYVVNGGRVFHLIAEGSTIFEARKRAYQAMSHIFIEGNNLQYRTDIGWREVERKI